MGSPDTGVGGSMSSSATTVSRFKTEPPTAEALDEFTTERPHSPQNIAPSGNADEQ
jgi:hypothetical protein